ncbi:MAG: hypothetical protein QOI10_2480 [Solirubrobacterales bacterium]|jgi:hypothetical protein|nr:hypothetical protein [Solirubrobacterales bacterium]
MSFHAANGEFLSHSERKSPFPSPAELTASI